MSQEKPELDRTDGGTFHLDTEVADDDRDFRVSTIRLRASLYGEMNFETCVFWEDTSRVLTRYPDQDAAESGHEKTVDAIRAGDYEITEDGATSFEVTRDV